MALVETQVVANELERVSPKVPTLFDRDATFYSQIEKRPVEVVSNRDMRIPLELRPGGNFGHFDPEGGDMGLGGGPTFDKAVINTVHLRHAIEWTKKAEWATDNSRKAVLDTFRHLLAKSMSEFRRQVDSLCMTAGQGVLGTITSVDTTGSKDTYTCTTDGFGVRLLRYGQTVSVYASDLSSRLGGDIIDLYDLAGKKVRLASNVGSSAGGCKIVIGGTTATGTNLISLKGVPYHHSDASTGYWLGLDRAANPEVIANRVNANGGLAWPFPRLAINKIGDRVGMDYNAKCVAWMHPCQKQAYEELGQLVSIIQKQPRAEALDLYFGDNMQMAGAPVKTSFSWDKKRIDFIISDVWGRAEMHPASFYTVDGRKIFEMRSTSSGAPKASSIFYITASFNLFVNNPAACSYIDGLSVPSGY